MSRSIRSFRARSGYVPALGWLLALAMALAPFAPARAAVVTLTGSDGYGQSSFDTGLNWSDGQPPAAGNDYSTANFLLRTPHESPANFTFGGDSLTIATGGLLGLKTRGVITVDNLILAGGLINQGGVGISPDTATLAGNMALAGGTTSTFNVVSGRTIQVDSAITGSGNFRVTGNGSGLVVLGAANNYTGTAIVDGGRLRVTTSAALPTDVTVNDGGTFDVGALNLRPRSFTIAGPGSAGQVGALVNTAGGAEASVEDVTLSGNATIGTTATKLNIFGSIQGNGNRLTIGGSGEVNIRTDNALNNLAGITVGSGRLRLESSHAPATPFAITVNSGAILDSWGARTYGGSLGLNLNGGTLEAHNAGPVNWHGPVSVSANSQVAANQRIDFWNDVSGAGTITKTGGNVLNFRGGVTSLGGLVINAGRVRFEGAGLGSWTGPITVNSGAILSPWGTQSTAAAITLAGGTLSVENGGTATYSGPVNLSTASFVDTAGGNVVLSNTVSGSGMLTKQGAGMLTLSGTNNYSGGTTVSDGTLRVNSPASLPTAGTTTVNAPATLNLLSSGTNTFSNAFAGDGRILLSFSGGTNNTYLNGNSSGFTGTLELAGSGGNKLNTTGLNISPSAAIKVNSGVQLFLSGGANLANPIEVVGTGNTENRGAIRLQPGTLSGTVTLVGNTTIGPEGGNITGNITSGAAGTQVLTLGTTSSLGSSTYSGVIGGGTGTIAVRVLNSNSGHTFIPGGSLNTYTGGTTLLHGRGSGTRLRIDGISGTPYGSGPITIGLAATDRAGIFFTTAAQTLANDLVVNTALGTDRPGMRSDQPNITLSGTVNANLAPATFSTNGTGSFRLTGQVTGASGITLHNQYGSSISVTLANTTGNPNNYQGDTVIQGTKGTVNLGAAEQIPHGPGAGNLVNNGALNMHGFDETVNALSGTGTIRGNSGTPLLTVGANNATSTFGGTLQDAGGTLSLVKTGSGTLTLAGNNPYTGPTTINGGVLNLHMPGSANHTYTGGTISINNGSMLQISRGGGANQYWFNGKTFQFGDTGAGTIDTTSGMNVVVYGGSVFRTTGGAVNSIVGASGFNLHAGHIITLDVARGADPASDLTVSAPLWNSGGVTKTGDGIVTLTAANTYTGATTVDAGTLMVNGSLGNTAVAVNSGATLGGTGSIAGTVTVNAGGTHAPGASVGSQPVGGETWMADGRFEFEINDALGQPGGPIGWDELLVGGTLDLTDLTAQDPFHIDIVSLSGAAAGDIDNFIATEPVEWPFLRYETLAGDFSGDLFSLDSSQFSNPTGQGYFRVVQMEYEGADWLAIGFVPEPGAWLLLLSAVACGLLVRRRK